MATEFYAVKNANDHNTVDIYQRFSFPDKATVYASLDIFFFNTLLQKRILCGETIHFELKEIP